MIMEVAQTALSALAVGGLAYLILKERGAPKPAFRTPSRRRPVENLRPMVGFTAAFAPSEPEPREPEPTKITVAANELAKFLNPHDPRATYDMVRRGGMYTISYTPAPPGAVNRDDTSQEGANDAREA